MFNAKNEPIALLSRIYAFIYRFILIDTEIFLMGIRLGNMTAKKIFIASNWKSCIDNKNAIVVKSITMKLSFLWSVHHIDRVEPTKQTNMSNMKKRHTLRSSVNSMNLGSVLVWLLHSFFSSSSSSHSCIGIFLLKCI